MKSVPPKRFTARVLLLVPVLLAALGTPAEAWCVHNETNQTLTATLWADSAVDFFKVVSINGNSGLCEDIIDFSGEIVDTTPLKVTIETWNFKGIAWTVSAGHVFVKWRDRSRIGVPDALLVIETLYKGPELIDWDPPWTYEDLVSTREVRFIATADPQFIQSGSSVAAGEWNENASRIMKKALDLIGTGDRRGRRGLIVAGDLTHDAYNELVDTYFKTLGGDGGLGSNSTGETGRLVYDGLGNHDYVHALNGNGCNLFNHCPDRIWDSISFRPRQTSASKRSGIHYSWDWYDVHFVQLNLAPSDTNLIDPGTAGASFDPQDALTFLKDDLAENVGTSGRPVILIHHYGFDCLSIGTCDRMKKPEDEEWWSKQQREDYWEAIANYNVVALITGHAHFKIADNTFEEWVRPSGRTDGPERLLDVVAGAARGAGDTVKDAYRTGAMTDFLIEGDWLYAGRLDEDGHASGDTGPYSSKLIYFGTPQAHIDPLPVTCDASGCLYQFKGSTGVSAPPAVAATTDPVTVEWQSTCGTGTVAGDIVSLKLPLRTTDRTCTITLTVKNSRDLLRKQSTADYMFTDAVYLPPVPTVLPPPPQTIEATGPGGAPASFTATASDYQDTPLTPVCLPASGSTFPLGRNEVVCTATDSFGQQVSVGFTITVVDTTPPIVTGAVTPAPNGHGWHNGPIQVQWTIEDAAGIETSIDCDPVELTFETAGTTLACSVTDRGGHTASASVSVRIDRTPPAILFEAPSPAANANGWHQSEVSIGYLASDAGSGLEPANPLIGQVTLTIDGVGLTRDVTVVDRAGNETTATTPAVNIDMTPPGLSANASGVIVSEGQVAQNTGSFSDVSPVTISASVGTITKTGEHAGSWSWSLGTSDGPQARVVTITASDGLHTAIADFVLTVNNVPPMASAGAAQDVVARQPFTLDGSWTDVAAALDAPYTWTWTPLATAVDAAGQPLAPLSGTSNYGEPIPYTANIAVGGAYPFRFTATDKDGGVHSSDVTVTVQNRFVAFGSNSVEIRSGASITGDVGAPAAATGQTLTQKGVEVSVGVNAELSADSAVYADSLIVKSSSSVPLAYFNELIDRGPGNVITEITALPAGIVAPALEVPAGEAGTEDIWLDGSKGDCNKADTTCLATGATLQPGSYGELRSRAGTKKQPNVLYLTGGDYFFEAVNLGRQTELRFTGPAKVYVAGQMDTDADSTIGPAADSGLAARDVLFHVGGINGKNGNIGSKPKSIQIGTGNTVQANFYAPNGTIWLRQGTDAIGAIVARDVEVGENVTLMLDSAF